MNGDNDTTVYHQATDVKGRRFLYLEVFYRGRVTTIKDSDLPYSVGRDLEKCHLILKDKLVSREHFNFEIRDDLIGLHDTSTNGTWVQLGRANSVQVKKSFLPLVGSGIIKPGSEIEDNNTNNLHFKIAYQ